MRFAFRVDSSPIIGMGHLLRCLALANGLKQRGFECSFICRDFAGNGASKFIADDFRFELLNVEGLGLTEDWLGVTIEKDVEDTCEIISQKSVDWLIIDHYEIDERWQRQFRKKFPDIKIMVIDDLLRSHECDILLDQTYGRKADEYLPLVTQNARYCLGAEFALLRSEFKALRLDAVHKPNHNVPHILVTLGGGDQGKPLRVIGKALNEVAKKHSFSATVITGNVPDEHLIDYHSLGKNVELINFSNNIAEEMTKADFVIGAGGGTSWERCCLGLPTVVLTIADNQIEIAKILNEKEAGISVATQEDPIIAAVERLLSDAELLQKMSMNAAGLCDGQGVDRVIDTILSASIKFRTASISDAKFIYDARYKGDASRFYRTSEVPTLDVHIRWLEKALSDDDYILLCMSLCGQDVSHIRLDKNAFDTGEIGICIAQDWRGRGFGKVILKESNQYFASLGFVKIYAEVHEENLASAKVFKQAGYEYLSTDSAGFMRYLWDKNG